SSAYSNFFDINWTEHKVFLPILAKSYGECLESGDISIAQENGRAFLKVSGLELPVSGSMAEHAHTVEDLDRIISAQPYRLGYWRKAADAINYRRFFDINDLIGLRAERSDVFEATHVTILDLIQRGAVDGLRIDHIDGLLDPKTYLDRLPDIYLL